MKKLLLFAAIAATAMTASAESFSDYFKLTCGDQTLANGETVTVTNYYDPIGISYPGMTLGMFDSDAMIVVTNVYDELIDVAISMNRIKPSFQDNPNTDSALGSFQLCYNGQCFGGESITGEVSLDADGGIVDLDIHQKMFTDINTPVTLQFDLCVMEGGEKLEGTDCTVYVKFTHEKDITMAVDGIMAEDGAVEYYNLLGTRVTNPQKGNVYIVRQGKKVSKRLF